MLVDVGLVADAFILPVGGEAALGDFVHPLTTNLNFYEAGIRASHGAVQAFVTVGFWRGHPVFQAFGYGLVVVRYNTVGRPTGNFLFIFRYIHHDAYGEEVVDLLEGNLLFLDLIVDAGDRFWPAVDAVGIAEFFEARQNRFNEALDVVFAGSLGFL